MATGKINTSWDFLRTFEQIDSGGFRHIALPSGIELIFLEVWSEFYTENVFDISAAPLELSFHLSGCGRGTMIQSTTIREHIEVSPGKALLSFNPGSRCRTRMMDKQVFRVLNIYIAPERLYALLEGDISQVPPCLGQILEDRNQTPFNMSYDISPATRMILDQMYNCVYQGTFQNLYLESKSMELMLRLMWEMAMCRKCGAANPLSGPDREQIRLARDILIREIDTPPSLKNLARKAGLNDTKLKRGFRQIFGTSVFGYLRRYRMEQSTRLLASGRMNVDETAHTLGFHDTAHFIRQFKQHYGTTPGTFLRACLIKPSQPR